MVFWNLLEELYGVVNYLETKQIGLTLSLDIFECRNRTGDATALFYIATLNVFKLCYLSPLHLMDWHKDLRVACCCYDIEVTHPDTWRWWVPGLKSSSQGKETGPLFSWFFSLTALVWGNTAAPKAGLTPGSQTWPGWGYIWHCSQSHDSLWSCIQ